MKQVKTKAFIEALYVFQTNVKNMKKCFSDLRLNSTEKKILEAWLLLRDSEHSKVLEKIIHLNTSYDELVDANKKLLLGINYNNSSQYHLGGKLISEAWSVIEKYDLSFFEFISAYNLFVLNFNLKNKDEMTRILNKMQTIPKSGMQEIQFLQCQFLHASFIENFKQCDLIIKVLKSNKSEMSELMSVNHWVMLYNHYIKTDEFDACESVLDDMKANRKFQYSANYNYMRIMLNHYLYDKPLYVYEKDFKGYESHFLQLSLLKSFEEGNLEQAQKCWKQLMSLFPHLYLEDYTYTGDKNIFSLCLEKWKKIRFRVKHESQVVLPSNKEDALFTLLNSSNAPLRKEDIYFKIWNELLVDKDQVIKLKKLVSRTRKKYRINIQFKKGCYFIANASELAS